MAAGVIVLGAVVPLAQAYRIVESSSRSQYNDYWPMISGMLAEDGSLRFAGFLEFRNEHPIFVPRLAYWLNAELFSGDNHALGYLVVAVVLAQVAIVALLARSTVGLGTWSRVSLVVTATALLLTPFGAWSFVKSMSGTAWLTANLFTLAALLAQQRDRRFLAPALALLATWSYGTGLAAWPALLLVVALGGREGWRRNWPTVVAGAAALAWYLLWFRSSDSTTSSGRGLLDSAHRFVERIGWPVVGPEWAFELGLVCLVLLAVGVALVARDETSRSTAGPWLGLATYALLSCALIVNARPDLFLTGVGVSRYASLGALAWLSTTAVLLVGLPQRQWRALLPLPLVAASWLGGGWVLDQLGNSTHQHDLLTVAMHLDLADGSRIASPQPFPELTERLRRAGHHPFDGRFSLDCGDLGGTVRIDEPVPIEGSWRAVEARAPGSALLRGSAAPDSGDVDCVVVLDGEDRVIGAGPWWQEEEEIRFGLIAREVPDPRVAIRFEGDAGYHVVGS